MQGRGGVTDPVDERETMDLQLTTDTPVPDGMLTTPHDRILKDDGYGRLVQLLDEAYELHNQSVTVSIVGHDPFELPIADRDYVAADGSVRLADDLVIMPDASVESSRDDGDGVIDWRGGHTVDDRRTTRFRIDGRAATIVIEDPLAPSMDAR
jgi:hypothetical protein